MTAAGHHIGRAFRPWVATLDGTKKIADMTGVTAVQYAGETQTGGHYDESIVYDPAWKAPAPPPPPPPGPPVHGYVVTSGAAGGLTGHAVTSTDSGKTWK